MGSIDKGGKDPETQAQKIPYPKAVLFILVCEFCERFCYYGMRTILTLYFVQVLSWSDDLASIVYHSYIVLSYFTPLLGAILADSWLGKFKTIFYLAIVYCAGCVVLSIAAIPNMLPQMAFSMVGLALIALGTGGIKPCVSAFGADQFKLPEQEVQVASFFAIFYFAINSGSLISTILTPVLREDVKCFKEDHCYSLAFGIPAALMIVALIIFVVAKPLYKVNKPEGNIVVKVLGAVKHSLGRKRKEVKAGRPREHWLDYADDKYDQRFLAEAKVLFKVLFLYIPLPFFWSLFDQQGSRWTLQATRMDGNTGGWVIKPDQMQVINPLLVLGMIPLFDRVIYPLLGKMNLLKKPLQKLTVGGIFAGIAFIVSGFIELGLEPTYAIKLKNSESNIHLVNGMICPLKALTNDGSWQEIIMPGEIKVYEAIEAKSYIFTMSEETSKDDPKCGTYASQLETTIVADNGKARSFIAVRNFTTDSVSLITIEDEDELAKSESGNSLIRVIHHGIPEFDFGGDILLQGDSDEHTFDYEFRSDLPYTEFGEVERKIYDLSLVHPGFTNGSISLKKSLDIKLGAVYIISAVYTSDPSDQNAIGNPNNYQIGFHEITKANSLHILLLIPQYIIMSMGEIMFSITIMDFSYAEGPPSMKSVMQSAWLMTVAVGNVIDVIIISVKFFDKQSYEFFLFAGLMFVDMAIFSYMAYTYIPADRFWLREDNQPGGKKKEEEIELQGKDNPALEHED